MQQARRRAEGRWLGALAVTEANTRVRHVVHVSKSKIKAKCKGSAACI